MRLALALLGISLPLFAAPAPVATATRDGVVVILPAAVLNDAAVAKQLAGGLTTVFVLKAASAATPARTVARLEVRYDLWDEVWHARRIAGNGRAVEETLQSRDALLAWWRTPASVAVVPSAKQLDVELTVLPFSAAEERDARDWISRAAAVTGRSGGALVDAVIGTTIAARPVTAYRWSVAVNGP